MDRALEPGGGRGGYGRRGGGGHRGGGRRGGRGGGHQHFSRKRQREEPDPDGSKAILDRVFHLADRKKVPPLAKTSGRCLRDRLTPLRVILRAYCRGCRALTVVMLA